MLKNGTLSDRIAAMTLIVQESPLESIETFDQLMSMTKKQQSREALLGIEAVKDLFLTNILPDRKLRRFHENDLGNSGVTDEHRIYWYFEDSIKEKYSNFIDVLNDGLQGTLLYFKRTCLKSVFNLLNGKPENESRLLQILVNKLGDPDHQVASKVVYLLQQILENH